jgi:hypothetical protein
VLHAARKLNKPHAAVERDLLNAGFNPLQFASVAGNEAA